MASTCVFKGFTAREYSLFSNLSGYLKIRIETAENKTRVNQHFFLKKFNQESSN